MLKGKWINTDYMYEIGFEYNQSAVLIEEPRSQSATKYGVKILCFWNCKNVKSVNIL